MSFRHSAWQILAVVFCLLFSAAYLINVSPSGDGAWLLDAAYLHSGHTLYAELHLPLQPLFILQTEAWQQLAGDSWLSSKLLGLLQAAIFAGGLLFLASFFQWKDWQKALLIPATFILTFTASYYRIDDYHIHTAETHVWLICLMILLSRAASVPRILTLCGFAGVLCGLSLTNRVTDGAGFTAAAAIAIVVLASRLRLPAIATFTLLTVVTALMLIHSTGDTVYDWMTYSILKASSVKGGTDHILVNALVYPLAALRAMLGGHNHFVFYVRFLVAALAIGLPFVLLPEYRERIRSPSWKRYTISAILAVSLFGLLRYVFSLTYSSVVVQLLAAALSGFLLWRLATLLTAHGRATWNPAEVLLLFPIGQLLATAMSSVRWNPDSNPVSTVLLLTPIVWSSQRTERFGKVVLLTLAVIAILFGFPLKIIHPFDWHAFHEKAMFWDRVWYQHPLYGSMYINREQLALSRTMCEITQETGKERSMLSVPFPYPNYFCGIAPWHGYIQTWFDTSSFAVVRRMEEELADRPPAWFAYQRQLQAMQLHRLVFGTDLPQLAVDRLVISRLRSGQWTVRYRQCIDGADWILIHTSPDPKAESLPAGLSEGADPCPAPQ